MTIKASKRMLQAHKELQQRGRIPGPPLPQRTGDIVRERVREWKARLELSGAPLRYRAQASLANPSDPTPERIERAGTSMGKIVTKVGGESEKRTQEVIRNYKIRHVVEQHGEKFEMSHRTALERFLQDADYAQRIKIADLNRAGGPSGGDRLGGLGAVPQHIRDGHARHQWVLTRLSLELQITARALVSREITKADGAPFSLEDFGSHMFPSVQDKNRRWGAGAGAVWALASQLMVEYQRCPVKVRKIDDEERMLELESHQ